MDWLFVPIDAVRAHEVGAWVSWHGRAMVLAWGVLAPLGVLIARFWKITPGQNWPHELDNRFWWRSHLILQWGAFVAFLAGLTLILMNDQHTPAGWWHRAAGWGLAGLASAQILLGLFRGSKGGPTDTEMRGDHFDMTPWRRMFERTHKSLGYLLLLLGVFGVVTGMWSANAPVWMWLFITVWWTTLFVIFARMQALGKAIDTYQAIWGPSPELPGNQMKPIGWGVTRRGSEPAE